MPAAVVLHSNEVPEEDTRVSDQRLLARAMTRDETALRTLFDRHAGPIHRFVKDLLNDAAAAQDATQETFIRAFARLSAVDDPQRMGAWFLGIARNVAFEQLRARRRFSFFNRWFSRESAGEADEPFDSRNPETVFLEKENIAALQSALLHLREDRRAALLLRYDHALSYEEIAQAMGWSLSKAKVEIHRAHKQLRAHLEPGEGWES